MEAVYKAAEVYLGLEEWPGAKHNPEVMKLFADVGHGWVQDDETPWCAAFVGAVLGQCGYTHTGKLNARSYLDWGEEVHIDDAQPGDVVVFWRKSKSGPYGHVAFFHEKRLDKIAVLGGNQGNAVSVSEYPKDRLLSIRRAKPQRTSPVQSKTIQGTITAGAGAAATGVTAVASLDGYVQMIAIGGLVLVALSLIWICRERLRKWAAGDR